MIISNINLSDAGELNFLMKSWKGCKLVSDGSKCAFEEVERAVRLLRGRNAEFICLRNPKKPEQIFALAVREGDVAHFVYVKRWFRRQGYASSLLQGCRYATFWTEAAKPLFAKLKLRRIDL